MDGVRYEDISFHFISFHFISFHLIPHSFHFILCTGVLPVKWPVNVASNGRCALQRDACDGGDGGGGGGGGGGGDGHH
jgi:hypothetical protein